MRFQVPQFIEKESKLVGPLTLRQFLWFLGGGVAFVLSWLLFTNGTVLITVSIIIALITAFMAFGKVNNMSGPNYVLNALVFLLAPKKLTFRNDEPKKP